MNNIIDFPALGSDIENIPIAVQRTDKFHEIAHSLSVRINGLPLSVQQNDDLVHEIVEQVLEAERGALMQGVQMGISLTKCAMEKSKE